MNKIPTLFLGAAFAIAATSCNSLAPVNNSPAASVEGLERQAPITPDTNVIGNAINARNAVDYSQGRTYGRYGGYHPYGY